jgi:hypothetical protein
VHVVHVAQKFCEYEARRNPREIGNQMIDMVKIANA